MGPYSERRPQVVAEESAGEMCDTSLGDNPGEQEVSGIRGDRATNSFLAVEGECVVSGLSHPEVTVKRRLDSGCGLSRFSCQSFLPPSAREVAEGPFRCHCVALDFDESDRRINSEMIIGTVFPTLVEEAPRILSFVLDIAVAIDIRKGGHPAVRRREARPKGIQEASVSGCLHILLGDNEEEGGRIDAPVVRKLPVRQLRTGFPIKAVFMKDLSRLFFRSAVHAAPLVRR